MAIASSRRLTKNVSLRANVPGENLHCMYGKSRDEEQPGKDFECGEHDRQHGDKHNALVWCCRSDMPGSHIHAGAFYRLSETALFVGGGPLHSIKQIRV